MDTIVSDLNTFIQCNWSSGPCTNYWSQTYHTLRFNAPTSFPNQHWNHAQLHVPKLLNFSFKFEAGQELCVCVYVLHSLIWQVFAYVKFFQAPYSQILTNFTHQAILVCGRSYTLSLANTAKACTQLVSYMWLDVRLYCCCHVQWPFSYCCPKKQDSCCMKPYVTTDFVIHSIWTLNSKRQIQLDCNGPLFDEHKVHFANNFPLPSKCSVEAGLIITLLPRMSVVWEIRLPLESFPCVLFIQVQFVRGFHSFPYREWQKSFLLVLIIPMMPISFLSLQHN